MTKNLLFLSLKLRFFTGFQLTRIAFLQIEIVNEVHRCSVFTTCFLLSKCNLILYFGFKFLLSKASKFVIPAKLAVAKKLRINKTEICNSLEGGDLLADGSGFLSSQE